MLELNSLGWVRGKKQVTINGDNDFKSALNYALNYQTTEPQPESISKLKPYINNYKWEGIEFPVGPKHWIKFKRNNKKIALNILFIQHNTKKIRIAYRSEYKNKCKQQVIFLMISNGKKQHYLAVTSLSAFLQKNSSNHKEDFYCLNCFNSYTTKNKLKEHEEIFDNHYSCYIEMTK